MKARWEYFESRGEWRTGTLTVNLLVVKQGDFYSWEVCDKMPQGQGKIEGRSTSLKKAQRFAISAAISFLSEQRREAYNAITALINLRTWGNEPEDQKDPAGLCRPE